MDYDEDPRPSQPTWVRVVALVAIAAMVIFALASFL